MTRGNLKMRHLLLSAALALAWPALAQDPPKQDPPQPPPDAKQPAPPAPPKVATDKEADEAVAAFKKDLSGAAPSGQIAAVLKAAETRHEKIIRAIAPLLASPVDDVTGQTALALASLDHPASAEVLARVLPSLENRPVAAAAVLSALGRLQYEFSVAPVNKWIDKSGDDDVMTFMDDVFACVSRIGSASSVDPLIDFRHKTEGTGRRGGIRGARRGVRDQDLVKLRRPCDQALATITGLEADKANDWEQAWKAAKPELARSATATWINKNTWVRVDCPAGAKPPCDKGQESGMVLVRVRMVESTDPVQKKKGGEGEGK